MSFAKYPPCACSYYASTAFPPRLAPPLKRPRLMPPTRAQHPKLQKQQLTPNTGTIPDLNQLKVYSKCCIRDAGRPASRLSATYFASRFRFSSSGSSIFLLRAIIASKPINILNRIDGNLTRRFAKRHNCMRVANFARQNRKSGSDGGFSPTRLISLNSRHSLFDNFSQSPAQSTDCADAQRRSLLFARRD